MVSTRFPLAGIRLVSVAHQQNAAHMAAGKPPDSAVLVCEADDCSIRRSPVSLVCGVA